MIFFALFALVICQDPFPTMPENPIFRNIFTADPTARVWADGRLYVYPSHDIFPPRGCDLMDGYHVFSTDDMLNWIDHGEILHSRDLSWGRPDGGFMWAPDCVFKNGKYYFYFPHKVTTPQGDDWKIGIAVSDRPTEGFKDIGQPMEGVSGSAMFDPNVLVDDDGRAYFYCGGGSRNENCVGGELREDMISLIARPQQMIGVVDFHEGTFVFKKGEMYYLTYPDNNGPGGNQMRYCISFSPLGPWTYMGVFLGPCDSGTSHGSIVEFKGQWFLFYHNKGLSGNDVLRSVCVDKIFFRDDGTIIYQEPQKSVIPPPETRPIGGTEYKVADYCTAGGTAIYETTPSGETAIAYFHVSESFATFRRISGGASGGKRQLYLRYSTNDSSSYVGVLLNGERQEYLVARGNGSWGEYSAYTHIEVNLNPGDNEIVLEGGHGGINILSLIVI